MPRKNTATRDETRDETRDSRPLICSRPATIRLSRRASEYSKFDLLVNQGYSSVSGAILCFKESYCRETLSEYDAVINFDFSLIRDLPDYLGWPDNWVDKN